MSSIRFDQVTGTDWGMDDLFFRERRQPAMMPEYSADARLTGQDVTALLPTLPVLAGALATAVVSLPALVSGVDAGQWLLGLLVAGAMVMVALAVTSERPAMLLVAAVNLSLVVLGAWLAAAGEITVTRLYIWHLVLVAITLLGSVPRREVSSRMWLGGELASLAMAGMFL